MNEYFIFLLSFVLLLLIIYILRNPTLTLLPYNILINLIYEKKVFYTEHEKIVIFPKSICLEKNWKIIRKEFLLLYKQNINYNIGSQFITEDRNFWKGWNTIVLKSFGKFSDNINKCGFLKNILKDENITTAFFSVVDAGKKIPAHYGPFKGILRYHLGLLIPDRECGECYISVDGNKYYWKNGEGVLFDESYLHYVNNNTKYKRCILFLDVKRPLHFPLDFINDIILYLMSISYYNTI